MCGYETEAQTRLAERMAEVIPSAELVRFAGSGTETTWHALRTARVATGRALVVKFEGHFHGYNDSLGLQLLADPSERRTGRRATEPSPRARACPSRCRARPSSCRGTTSAALEAVFAAPRADIAAVVMEPVNLDSGTHPATPRLPRGGPRADHAATARC